MKISFLSAILFLANMWSTQAMEVEWEKEQGNYSSRKRSYQTAFPETKVQAPVDNKKICSELSLIDQARKYKVAAKCELEKSIQLLAKAELSENPEVNYELGKIRLNNFGDITDGLFYLEKAAEQGHAAADFQLGTFYYNNYCFLLQECNFIDQAASQVVANGYLQKAVTHYKKAAKKGYLKAQLNLAHFYNNNDGGLKDAKKSEKFYLMAAEQDCEEAWRALAEMYEDTNTIVHDYTKSAYFRQKLIDSVRDEESHYFLGAYYEEGHGGSKDYRKAAENYQAAVVYPNTVIVAAAGLSNLYAQGKGVCQDLAKAHQYNPSSLIGEF